MFNLNNDDDLVDDSDDEDDDEDEEEEGRKSVWCIILAYFGYSFWICIISSVTI